MRIEFENVHVRFGERAVLEQVSLTLTESRIALIGANGSGKSTLARLINGLVTPSSGIVRVDGIDVAKHASAVRARVGFVFTNPDNQIVMPTVREDVAFSIRRMRLSKAESARRVEQLLHDFGLTELADLAAHSLSGGQKQLLALASVLAAQPDLIVADEPTTLLDARNAQMLNTRFAELNEQLIVATHQLDSITDFDRVLVLDRGKVVADAPPREAIANYLQLLES